MKKAIVIGGSGFLGSELLRILSVEKTETLVIVNKSKPVLFENQKTIQGGIEAVSTSFLTSFQPDVIFHCARPTLPKLRKLGRIVAARKASRLNRNLLRNIENSHQSPKLIFASGSLMYGNSREAHDESSSIRPISYAKQYFKGEKPLVDAVKKNNLSIIILRFPWLLGNGSWFKWFYLENILKNKTIPRFGTGDNLMEIVDVKDAAKLMSLYASIKSGSGIFNICHGKPVSQLNFVKEVSDVFSGKIVDYKSIFPKGPEKEAIEAFTSNILLKSRFNAILESFEFSPLKKTLEKIKNESDSGQGF